MRKRLLLYPIIGLLISLPSAATGVSKNALLLTGNNSSGLGATTLGELLATLNLSISLNPGYPTLTDYDLVVLDGDIWDSSHVGELRSYLQFGGKVAMTGDAPRSLARSDDLTAIADVVGFNTFGEALNGRAIVGTDNPYCLPYWGGDPLGSVPVGLRPYLANPAKRICDIIRWEDSSICSYTFRSYGGKVFYLADIVGDSTKELFRAAISSMLKLSQHGDADGSGDINISDAVYLISYIFSGGAAPRPFVSNGDVNCDGAPDISDVVYLINYIFVNGPPPCARCYRGAVYVVTAMDTEPILTTGPTEHLLGVYLSNFDSTGASAYVSQVMDPAYRNSLTDSYGGHIKFSFFLETGEYFCHSDKLDCNGIYTPMEKFHPAIATFGDELGWHFHNSAWVQASWDTLHYYWSQIITFNGTMYWDGPDIGAAEKALDHWLIDKNFFPSTFRSGWVWENNDFSNWLDEVVPFDFSNLSPHGWDQPSYNIFWDYYDWRRAPQGWVSYHPNRFDYQSSGNLRRTILHSNYTDPNDPESGLPTHQLQEVFARAARGENVYVSVYGHTSNPLTTFFQQGWYNDLVSLSAQYQVPFKFATSLEAARAVTGYDADSTAPIVTITREGDSLAIVTSETIFQRNPYCALKRGDIYSRVIPTPSGDRRWTVDVTGFTRFTVAIGVCDFAGNVTVARWEE